MAVKAIAAVVGAVAATVGTAASIKNQGQQAKFQRQAAGIERRANNYQAARERREAIRQSRIAYAQQANAAEIGGVSTSSGALGGQASTISQTRDNVSFLDNYGILKDASAQVQTKASAAGAKAGAFGSIAGLGFQVFSSAGGVGAIKGG
jgi:hypothetical protein